MTLRKALGVAILASPFILMFAIAATRSGIVVAVGIFGAVAALVALIAVGSWLVFGDLS